MSGLFDQLASAIAEGASDQSPDLVQKALDLGFAPKDILDNGLIAGMTEVGVRFKCGEMFVPEVLMSAETMQAGMEVLRPYLIASGVKLIGKIVLGTVNGDLHDIGKNLVGMMCEGAGFEVIDLGVNVPAEAFVNAIKTHAPDVIGMSALLTTTMISMERTVKAIEEAGLREKVKIMVGGAPLDQDFATRINSDGYGSNAVAGAELAKRFVGAS